MRNGRYVIPVRSDARGVIRGLVHDHSSSGATLYIEPLQTTELNNRWRELQLQEQEEIDRILRFISERVAAQAPAILEAVTTLGRSGSGPGQGALRDGRPAAWCPSWGMTAACSSRRPATRC